MLKLGESHRFDQAQIKFMVKNTIFAIINTFEWRMILFLAARPLPSEGFGTAPESERSSVDDVAVGVGTIHIRRPRPQWVSNGVPPRQNSLGIGERDM